MPSDPFTSAIAALCSLDGQRVWSLLVSVFGDLAQGEGQVIQGPVLSRIMANMNTRPEATRVALHRLRKDGWITSEKSGRTRRHGLTAFGRTQSAAASPRIYGTSPQTSQGWQVVFVEHVRPETTREMESQGFIPLGQCAFAGTDTATAPDNALVLKGSNVVPNWVKQQITPEGLTQSYAQLDTILQEIDHLLPEDTRLSALQIAALRSQVVHNWRRIILKHPDIPATLLPDGWAGHRCKDRVSALLRRFPRPDLSDFSPD